MKPIRFLVKISIILGILHGSILTFANTKDLECEHLINPIGIDAPNPRLTWRSETHQSAYQIIVGTDSMQVLKGIGNAWQTAKIISNIQLETYKGKALKPFIKYFWKVVTWDKANKISIEL